MLAFEVLLVLQLLPDLLLGYAVLESAELSRLHLLSLLVVQYFSLVLQHLSLQLHAALVLFLLKFDQVSVSFTHRTVLEDRSLLLLIGLLLSVDEKLVSVQFSLPHSSHLLEKDLSVELLLGLALEVFLQYRLHQTHCDVLLCDAMRSQDREQSVRVNLVQSVL